jgi:hypothetical protein
VEAEMEAEEVPEQDPRALLHHPSFRDSDSRFELQLNTLSRQPHRLALLLLRVLRSPNDSSHQDPKEKYTILK